MHRKGDNLFEPPFSVQTFPQIRAGQGLQDTYHSLGQVTFLGNLADPGIDSGFFAIEANNETGNDI